MEGEEFAVAVCFLWMVLHHKVFLRSLAEEFKQYKAGLFDLFSRASVLQDYKALTSTAVKSWTHVNFPAKNPKTNQRAPRALCLYEQKLQEQEEEQEDM